MAGKLKITLVKSTIGAIPKHRKTVEALGLKKLNKTVEMPDNAATRGQIQQIRHLVKVEGIISNPKDGVKILGNGELTKKLDVKVNAYSASAAEKIQAAGGKAEVI